MATPPNATGPRNNAFAGGSITPASNPVAVGGTFGGPGAASTPPNVGQPPILSARNNSGSNVRIPYARLVPMRSKQMGADNIMWAAVPDINPRGGEGGPLSGRPIGQEYDGLESGELAWIMGRKFLSSTSDSSWKEMTQSAHGLGMGFGVDRMQRLAYTSWMEAYFRAVFGHKQIVLNTISLSGEQQVYMSDELKKYSPYLSGATVLGSVDLPHTLNALYQTAPNRATLQYQGAYDRTNPYGINNPPRVNVADIRGDASLSGLASGLFVLEKGPFLRGKIIDDDAVEMLAPELSTPNARKNIFHNVPRNLGDRLAFDALYSEMRSLNFFDWSPDGMVLSKLESPTDEPMSSAELDARQAQLFNVCIQGPAIAKTWTGDPRMQCLPLDKVFIVMIADISSVVDNDGKMGAGATAELAAAWDEYTKWVRPDNGAPSRSEAGKADVINAIDEAKKAFRDVDGSVTVGNTDYAKHVDALFKAQGQTVGGTPDSRDAASTAVANARGEMNKFFGPLPPNFDAIAADVKQGKKGISKSVMTNFSLKRVTSSYLAATSACVVNGLYEVDSKSRCGLRLGASGPQNYTITGEYIIGGWCIGTVIDSAASRSTIGNMVKTAPASMAINLNVNVEWWSGDDLYKRYMDVSQTVFQRGDRSKWDDDTTFQKAIQAREARLDVPAADLPEFNSWQPFTS